MRVVAVVKKSLLQISVEALGGGNDAGTASKLMSSNRVRAQVVACENAAPVGGCSART